MNFVFNEMFLVFPVNVSGEDIKQRLKVKATKSRIKQEGKSAPWRIKRGGGFPFTVLYQYSFSYVS